MCISVSCKKLPNVALKKATIRHSFWQTSFSSPPLGPSLQNLLLWTTVQPIMFRFFPKLEPNRLWFVLSSQTLWVVQMSKISKIIIAAMIIKMVIKMIIMMTTCVQSAHPIFAEGTPKERVPNIWNKLKLRITIVSRLSRAKILHKGTKKCLKNGQICSQMGKN